VRLTLLTAAVLAVAACDPSPPPATTIERPPLRLSLDKEESLDRGKVEPAFVAFKELAGVLVPPPRTLAFPGDEVDPTASFFHPEAEPNNTLATATQVRVPGTFSGHMDPLPTSVDGDHDWYMFVVERDKPAILKLSLSGVKRIDLGLEVYHDGVGGRNRLLQLNNAGPGQGEKLPNFRLTNGRYFLHIHQIPDKKGKTKYDVVRPYRIELSLEELSGKVEETEPNDDYAHAVVAAAPLEVSGVLNGPADRDWYLLDLLQVSTYSYLSFELLPGMGRSATMEVYTSARELLLIGTAEEGRKLLFPNVAVIDRASAYYVVVGTADGEKRQGEYTLVVRSVSTKERVELEPNGTADLAVRLYYEEATSGWLAIEGDEDWYRLEPGADWGTDDEGNPEQPALNVVLSGVPGLDLVLTAFEADGEISVGKFDSGSKGEGEEIPNLAMPVRPLLLRVSAREGANPGLQYALEARAVTTVGKEIEPNNTMEQASTLPGDSDTAGYLLPRGDRDCFVLAGGDAKLSIEGPTGADMLVSAYGPLGNLIFQETARPGKELPVELAEASSRVCVALKGGKGRPPRTPYVIRVQGGLADSN